MVAGPPVFPLRSAATRRWLKGIMTIKPRRKPVLIPVLLLFLATAVASGIAVGVALTEMSRDAAPSGQDDDPQTR
jgi:hypothetical protein